MGQANFTGRTVQFQAPAQPTQQQQRISHGPGHGLIGMGGGIPSGLSCVAQIFVNAESMDRLPEVKSQR